MPPAWSGIDVARGLALLGMLAVHTLPTFTDDGDPSTATVLAAGRSAATFVLVAGIGLAFVSGGRRVVRGAERVAVSAGLAVRAAIIGTLGLGLGVLSEANGVDGILPYYGLFFLLAIPLLGLTPRALAGLAAAAAVLGPVLLVVAAKSGWPTLDLDGDPTPAVLLEHPLGLLNLLTVTGEYPAVVYLALLCAGLAVGRLDLRSRRVAWSLLGGGLALAVLARLVSALLLYPLGGLAALTAQADSGDSAAEVARELLWNPDLWAPELWDPERSGSWWYLALPAPHSHSIVDAGHTLGSALAVVGAALLVTRIAAVARLLEPLAAAGSMALTLYSAHLLVLATGLGEDEPELLYALLVVGALAFGWGWRPSSERHFRPTRLDESAVRSIGMEPGGRRSSGQVSGGRLGWLVTRDDHRAGGDVDPERPHWLPSDVDPTRPSVARVYDYYLGGSHNFEPDRAFARQVIASSPGVVRVARDNREFLRRAVRYAGEQGVDQFLDLGSGIPTVGNVHEVARAANPRSRVVYVDHDPIAVTHSRALLAGQQGVTAIAGDLAEPDAVLADAVATGGLDLRRPVAVLLLSVLHFFADDRKPAAFIARYLAATAPGSQLAISHAQHGEPWIETAAAVYGRTRSPGQVTLRSRPEIADLFAGTDLVEPGLVAMPYWRPEAGDAPVTPICDDYAFLAGVGRRSAG